MEVGWRGRDIEERLIGAQYQRGYGDHRRDCDGEVADDDRDGEVADDDTPVLYYIYSSLLETRLFANNVQNIKFGSNLTSILDLNLFPQFHALPVDLISMSTSTNITYV